MAVDINKEIENFEKAKNILARPYMDPKNAIVDISPKLYDLVSKAHIIEEGKTGNEIIIDDEVYFFEIDDKAHAFPYLNSIFFRHTKDPEKVVEKEARKLYKEFKKRGKNELLAFLESKTAFVHLVTMTALEKEE